MLQARGHSRRVGGMDADAADFLSLELFERAQDQAMERLRVNGQFAADDPARNRQGQANQILLRLPAQARAEFGDLLNRAGEALHHGLHFGRRLRLAGGFSFFDPCGASFADAVFDFVRIHFARIRG